MRKTYRATLTGDHLEWHGDSPNTGNRSVAVQVKLLTDASEAAQQGKLMVAALEQLAGGRAFAEVENPVAWEREVRDERELPDRS